ncbi:tyrosine-type recombinase/integrase [Peribacillus butanolivorans]|uniref:tyrosine-type recombinase/integrase n=1 Tax=Peribacillus butanolivorans TaxID=421767 RepID=UPI0039FD58BC
MLTFNYFKDRRTVIETFTREQIHKLLKSTDLRTFTGVRDYTIMLLLLETGVRASELIGIETDDIRWEDSMILIHNTKGHRERLVPFQSKMRGLSKEVCYRVLKEVEANPDIDNFGAYFRTCLENTLYKSQLKHGQIDPYEIFEERLKDSNVQLINW